MKQHKLYTLEAYDSGEIAENLEYRVLGRAGRDLIREPESSEISLMPYATELCMLPGRDPMGIFKGNRKHYFKSGQDSVTAVAMLPPSGYTRTLLPAYHVKKNIQLPFFGYTMAGYSEDNLYIAAVRTDHSLRWDPTQYNSPDLKNKIKKKLKKFPQNRLLKHLAHCAEEYHCYNAQNIFYDRWEGGIPTSTSCNAGCEGCISRKRKSGAEAPQDRITFVPSLEEIVEIAVPHLNMGRAIISFGQGCEGEPSLQGELIARSIKAIREKTDRGTLHMNSNGSNPEILKKLIASGLDSIRISMNSAIEETYNPFFRPATFRFKDVKESVKIAVEEGLFVSINLLTMPGINDNENEVEQLLKFLDEYKPSMVQMRNLNMDPELFFSKMPTLKGKAIGIVQLLKNFKERYGDKLIVGNFNRAIKE